MCFYVKTDRGSQHETMHHAGAEKAPQCGGDASCVQRRNRWVRPRLQEACVGPSGLEVWGNQVIPKEKQPHGETGCLMAG